MEETNKKTYEVGFLVSQDTHVEEIQKVLKDHGAEISFQAPLQRVGLAYPISGRTTAQFGFVHAEIEPQQVPLINDALNLVDEVMRFLIVKPSAIATERQSGKRESSEPRRDDSTEQKTDQKRPKRLTNEDLQEQLEQIMN